MALPPEPRPLGRRSPLRRELIDRFVELVRDGAFLKDAAAYVGVSDKTAHRWKAHADDPEPKPEHYRREVDHFEALCHWRLCCEFRDAVETAEAQAKITSMRRIRTAGSQGTWQADAWYLERRYPAEYGRRIAEVSGPEGGPIQIEDARTRLAELLGRVAKEPESEPEPPLELEDGGA